MKVYRLELLTPSSDYPNVNEGPYLGPLPENHPLSDEYDRWSEVFGVGSFSSFRHPMPEEDDKLAPVWEGLRRLKCYFFGFESIKQFKRWFYDDSSLKVAAPYAQIGIYECKEAYFGRTQAVFNAKTAKRVGILPITVQPA